jgi:tRNA-specific 2-thiouridylase
VVVGEWDELHREELAVGEMNWLAPPARSGESVSVQIRHRAAAADAEVLSVNDDEVRIRFREPQRAAAPGQSAVVFSGERVLGGGRIAG